MSVEDVVKSFAEPFFHLNIGSEKEKVKKSKMLGLLLIDTNAEIRSVFYKKTQIVDSEYMEILKNLLPLLSTQELCWRYKHMIGLIINNIGGFIPLGTNNNISNDEVDNKIVLEWIVTYITAALLAPPSSHNSIHS
ncbi:hypothetical protein ACR3I8_12145 [Priestia flexa]